MRACLAIAALRYAGGLMLVTADSLGYTLALLVTFLGVGAVAAGLVTYAVFQVMAEHQQNQEANDRTD